MDYEELGAAALPVAYGVVLVGFIAWAVYVLMTDDEPGEEEIPWE